MPAYKKKYEVTPYYWTLGLPSTNFFFLFFKVATIFNNNIFYNIPQMGNIAFTHNLHNGPPVSGGKIFMIFILDNQFILYEHSIKLDLKIYIFVFAGKPYARIIKIDEDVRYHDFLDLVNTFKFCFTANAEHAKNNTGLIFFSNIPRDVVDGIENNVFIINSMMKDFYKLGDNCLRSHSKLKSRGCAEVFDYSGRGI